jgi:predicted amidohydrolase YtcJ
LAGLLHDHKNFLFIFVKEISSMNPAMPTQNRFKKFFPFCRNRRLGFYALILVSLFAVSRTSAQEIVADRIVQGGTILTMDASRPSVEAVAIAGDRILATGSARELKRFVGPKTEVIELTEGQMAIPGLIEGHGHFLGLGQSLMMLKLSEAETWDEIVEQVAAAAKVTPPGQWIIGRGWHQSKWKEAPQPNVEGYPTTKRLDELTPNHPVLLTHASGHMSLANGYAMRMAKVDGNTRPPAGGEILKDDQGNPTGVFRETAQSLINQVQSRDELRMSPDQQLKLTRKAIELAGAECLKYGITSFQDAGTSLGDLRLLRNMAIANELPIRLWMMVRDNNNGIESELPQLKSIGLGRDFFTFRAIKLSIDGALGPHGAWLLEPYQDMPTSTGLNTIPIEDVQRAAELAVKFDCQLCVHAIGDKANQVTLNLFEEALKKHPSPISRRWRIEHAQHLAVADIPRFGQLGVIASMQGIHCTSDAIFVLQRLGNLRAKQGAYVWRSLLESGAVVTNGTDAPVENVNPFPSLQATITRRLGDGMTFFPEQCLTREEALRSYSIDCAYAAFEETIKGSLVAGKLADITIVDRNLLTCPAETIGATQVVKTILGGKVVYSSTNSDSK